jgi:hypothetical protein
MAVQNDGYTGSPPGNNPHGLLWYRSNDEGATWSYYRGILVEPDPAIFDQATGKFLHLTADLIAVGNDIAAVYSYDTTGPGFPADSWDPKRVVYFQWWRYDGVNDWNAAPGSLVTVASVSGTQAYHRAEIARDSLGRIWIQAFLRRSDCTSPGQLSCTGDLLHVWVSTDPGATSFQGPQTLATLDKQIGGGRLISLGSKLMMLWNDYSGSNIPAQMMTRNDSDPVTTWSPAVKAFADSARIYHGAALSAAADGVGGLHLVYKEWIGSPDVQQLYYRRYNNGSFGAKQAVGATGDWATQPAVSRVGDDLYVCVNHMIATNSNYEMRVYMLSNGWTTFQAIDTLIVAKAYPTALEVGSTTASFLPCAFGTGDPQQTGLGHTVKVAREPLQGDFSLSANPSTVSVVAGPRELPASVSLQAVVSLQA